jgi:uncharacterized protein YndB with AHSA1/START domain
MKGPGDLRIVAKSELEVAMTRTFDAPRRLVWDAWTKPELLQRWLGIQSGWTMPLCRIDLRPGGSYRYVWQGPDGMEMAVGGVFREIVRPERIVCTEKFDQAWYPGEALITHVLTEEGERTTSTITILYESQEARDAVLASPMESGVAEGYRVLDGVLRELQEG